MNTWVPDRKRTKYRSIIVRSMGLLPDTYNCGLRMRRECRERFPRHRLQRKPLVSDPGMHHGSCVMHAPWCISGSLTRGVGENVPGIPGACESHNFDPIYRYELPPWRQPCPHVFMKAFLYQKSPTICWLYGPQIYPDFILLLFCVAAYGTKCCIW